MTTESSHIHHETCDCAHAHDQSERAATALTQVEEVCRSRGVRLTPIRKEVLKALYATHRPLGAYDIIDALSQDESQRKKRRLAPITIYRALDFLLEQGFAHRLSSCNAFVACPHNHAPEDIVAFLICTECGGVDELCSAQLTETVSLLLKREQFKPSSQVMEITGRCSHCH